MMSSLAREQDYCDAAITMFVATVSKLRASNFPRLIDYGLRSNYRIVFRCSFERMLFFDLDRSGRNFLTLTK